MTLPPTDALAKDCVFQQIHGIRIYLTQTDAFSLFSVLFCIVNEWRKMEALSSLFAIFRKQNENKKKFENEKQKMLVTRKQQENGIFFLKEEIFFIFTFV